MKTINGWAYRYGDRQCVSLDEVVGAKACRLELADEVTVREVTRHEALLDGERVPLARLLLAEKVRVVEVIAATRPAKEAKSEKKAPKPKSEKKAPKPKSGKKSAAKNKAVLQ